MSSPSNVATKKPSRQEKLMKWRQEKETSKKAAGKDSSSNDRFSMSFIKQLRRGPSKSKKENSSKLMNGSFKESSTRTQQHSAKSSTRSYSSFKERRSSLSTISDGTAMRPKGQIPSPFTNRQRSTQLPLSRTPTPPTSSATGARASTAAHPSEEGTPRTPQKTRATAAPFNKQPPKSATTSTQTRHKSTKMSSTVGTQTLVGDEGDAAPKPPVKSTHVQTESLVDPNVLLEQTTATGTKPDGSQTPQGGEPTTRDIEHATSQTDFPMPDQHVGIQTDAQQEQEQQAQENRRCIEALEDENNQLKGRVVALQNKLDLSQTEISTLRYANEVTLQQHNAFRAKSKQVQREYNGVLQYQLKMKDKKMQDQEQQFLRQVQLLQQSLESGLMSSVNQIKSLQTQLDDANRENEALRDQLASIQSAAFSDNDDAQDGEFAAHNPESNQDGVTDDDAVDRSEWRDAQGLQQDGDEHVVEQKGFEDSEPVAFEVVEDQSFTFVEDMLDEDETEEHAPKSLTSRSKRRESAFFDLEAGVQESFREIYLDEEEPKEIVFTHGSNHELGKGDCLNNSETSETGLNNNLDDDEADETESTQDLVFETTDESFVVSGRRLAIVSSPMSKKPSDPADASAEIEAFDGDHCLDHMGVSITALDLDIDT